MIDKIIDNISKKLFETFGDKYTIYTENVEQGLKEPCFFIDIGELEEKQLMNNRYQVNIPVIVQYLSNSKKKKQDCYTKFDELTNALEIITIEDYPIRGKDISSDYSGGILTFSINYEIFVLKTKEPINKLKNYNLNSGVKER